MAVNPRHLESYVRQSLRFRDQEEVLMNHLRRVTAALDPVAHRLQRAMIDHDLTALGEQVCLKTRRTVRLPTRDQIADCVRTAWSDGPEAITGLLQEARTVRGSYVMLKKAKKKKQKNMTTIPELRWPELVGLFVRLKRAKQEAQRSIRDFRSCRNKQIKTKETQILAGLHSTPAGGSSSHPRSLSTPVRVIQGGQAQTYHVRPMRRTQRERVTKVFLRRIVADIYDEGLGDPEIVAARIHAAIRDRPRISSTTGRLCLRKVCRRGQAPNTAMDC